MSKRRVKAKAKFGRDYVEIPRTKILFRRENKKVLVRQERVLFRNLEAVLFHLFD